MPAVLFACSLDATAFDALLPLAIAVARRGLQVLFLADPTFRARTEAAGIEFVRMTHADDESPVYPGLPRRTEVARRLIAFEYTIRRHHIDPLAGQHAVLQSALARLALQHPEDPAPVLIHDTMFLGAWPLLLGASGLRPAKVLSIGVMPPPALDDGLAPFGMALPPDDSAAGLQRNQELNEQAKTLFANAQAALDWTLRRCGATRPAPFVLDGMLSLPDQTLQLGIPQFEYPRRQALPTLRHVGLVPAAPDDVGLPAWWPDLDTARPVVFVAAGETAGGDLDPLVRATLYALRGEPVLVVVAAVWNIRRFGPLPVNARAASPMPMDALLPWVDVAIGRGDYAEIQRALSHGIPVVIEARSESEREVAARAVRAGAGVQLMMPVAVEEILAAVQTVTETLSFLVGARRLRQAYANHDAVESIVAAILAPEASRRS